MFTNKISIVTTQGHIVVIAEPHIVAIVQTTEDMKGPYQILTVAGVVYEAEGPPSTWETCSNFTYLFEGSIDTKAYPC